MTQQAWDKELRARGYRVTPQRQLVLEAVTKLEHASPEEIWADVQQTASGVNISTIYRALELLEQLGLVTHTHLGHGAPRYHLAAEADHVHLVCSSCGRITQVPPDAVEALVSALDESDGFQTDVGHLTVFGRCASCRAGDRAAGPGDAAAVEAMPGSTWIHTAVPSSVRVRWCSTCPFGLSSSACVASPGARCSVSCVVRLCSQDSRSWPVIRSTP